MSQIAARSWKEGVLDRARDLLVALPSGKKTLLYALIKLLNIHDPFIGRVERRLMAIDPADWYGAFNLYVANGGYETDVMTAISECLPMGGTFVDAGANKGYLTVKMQECVGTGGSGLCFEPLPVNLRDIEITLAHNKVSNVEVIPKALSDSVGQSYFTTNGIRCGRFSWGYLVEECVGDAIVVKTTTLDAELSKRGLKSIDLLKLDIEGAERRALEGTFDSLSARHIRNVIVEVHAASIGLTQCLGLFEFMRGLGFSAQGIGDDGVALVSVLDAVDTSMRSPATPPVHRGHVHFRRVA